MVENQENINPEEEKKGLDWWKLANSILLVIAFIILAGFGFGFIPMKGIART